VCTEGAAGSGPRHVVQPVGDWSGETITLEPVDELRVLSVCDNTVDILLPDEGVARRQPMGGDTAAQFVAARSIEGGKVADAPLAQHGFSALVTPAKAGRSHQVLFDTGLTPDGCVDNLRRLGHDPADIEAVVCSHGHFDHTTGLSGLMTVLGHRNMPVLIHPEFWTRRRIAIPGRDPIELPTTSRRAFRDTGFEIVAGRRPSFLFDGSLLITGEVDRTTDFERGFAIHEALRGERWEPDPLILDDQALIAHVAGKGLVVLTGCGHAGLINIVRYAQRLTGINDVYAIIGGFHLNGPLFEPVIAPTCDALAELRPRVLVPAHCTGWRAVHTIAARFPEAFIQNSVGTTYVL
jgi:7,8-dihydropterin-6-yl-methyl-4-(beta-D-ribofuranosyl)aminobenzene 5'-phosphate synthase